MKLTTERNEGMLVARVEGRLDGSTVTGIEEAVRTVIGQHHRAVPIDCADLRSISSAGLRAVPMFAKTLLARNARFAHLCSLSEPPWDVFRVSGFHKIVAIHPSKFESLASLHP